MSKYLMGEDALAELNREAVSEEKTGGEFYKMKTGDSVKVRVLTLGDMLVYRGYGHFKKGVHTFAAEEPSVYSDKGFPKSNMTPWDKAFEHYSKLAFNEKNEAKQKKIREVGRQFIGSKRFAVGFINIETGEPIIVDFTQPQAKAVFTVLQKNAKKLDKKAFELEKTGEGTKTTFVTTPLDLEDLEPEELTHFEAAEGKEFDKALFENLIYEADEVEQVEFLTRAGFDISLIGYSKDSESASDDANGSTGDEEEDDGDDLPF